MRIRIHDDLGLNRVLHTGKDFVFIGFDGRSDRPLGGRRIKRSPLRDVASMLMSFQYAAQAVFFDQLPGVSRRPESMNALEFWASYWSDWVSAVFLKAYLDALGETAVQKNYSGQITLIPRNEADLRLLLDHCLLEQALEGAREELRGRPGLGPRPDRNAAPNSRSSPPVTLHLGCLPESTRGMFYSVLKPSEKPPIYTPSATYRLQFDHRSPSGRHRPGGLPG